MNQDLIEKIIKFRDERNWDQFHNPKDLAISISIEAAELLETFQWSGADLEKSDKLDNMKEEIADVLIYSILLAEKLNLDISEIIEHKLKKNGEKYQKDKAYGTSKKYTELR
ncbi:nucleotide pyrophosphohydrolase [Proteiniclasticum sp. SCR006]|uniref:Nucleotide pyrophosphohydrolase n=1 Tax=Proteiniclasticum aestuarii TaxID=2817862 RepID=A0A939KGX1_9CLOT|nr:nucleotide pyrophosphohydrolase [Proteiniclasticum aestuarii]MBO1264869.1 nucleotide pyrophosphohydrolase [Proteiniclasticum aestuarii]